MSDAAPITMEDEPITFTSEGSAVPGGIPPDDYYDSPPEKPRRLKSPPDKDPFAEPGAEGRRHRHKTPEERAARRAKKEAAKIAQENAENLAQETAKLNTSESRSRTKRRGSQAPVPLMDSYTPTPQSRKHKKLDQMLGAELDVLEKEKKKHRKHDKGKERRKWGSEVDRSTDRPREGRRRKESLNQADEDLGARMSRAAAGILGLKNGAEMIRELSRSPSRTSRTSRTRSPSQSRGIRLRRADIPAEPPPPSSLPHVSEERGSRRKRHHRDRAEGEEGQRRHRSKAPTDPTDSSAAPRERRHRSHATGSVQGETDGSKEHHHKSKSRVRSLSRHVTDSEVGTNAGAREPTTHGVPEGVKEEERHRRRHRDKDKDKDKDKEKKSRSKSRHLNDSQDRKAHKAAKTSSRTNGPIPVSSEPDQGIYVPGGPVNSYPPQFQQEPSAQELDLAERAHIARRAERKAKKSANPEDVPKDSGHSLSSEGRKDLERSRQRHRSKSFSTPEEEEAYRLRKERKRARRQLPGEGTELGYLSPVDERVRRHRDWQLVGTDGDRHRGDKEKVKTRRRSQTEPPPMDRPKVGLGDSGAKPGFSLKSAFSRFWAA